MTGLVTLTGLHDEPLMSSGHLAANPGYWSATPQQLLTAYFTGGGLR